MGTFIDMTQPGMRKRLAVISAIGRLDIEMHGMKYRTSTLKAMQAWGFTSKRKAAMLTELKQWLEEDKEEHGD